jgi:hypothetical protein
MLGSGPPASRPLALGSKERHVAISTISTGVSVYDLRPALCRQLELSEFLKDLQELRLRSEAHVRYVSRKGSQISLSRDRLSPLGANMAFFSINYTRCALIGGKFLLSDIFAHVGFAHVLPYKAKPLFYVSELSRSDCQSPGLA